MTRMLALCMAPKNYIITRIIALYMAPIVIPYMTAIVTYIKTRIIDLYMAVIGMEAIMFS
jgi:hypothetical protein